MRNSKLVRILKKLSRDELHEFRDFVQSPFFNKNSKCTALYQLLLRYSPDFSNPKMDEPKFASSIYTNKRSLETTIEKLLRLLEEYLAQRRLSKNGVILKRYFLLEELRERREEKHYNLIHKQTVNKLNKKKEGNDYFYETYLIEVSRLEMTYQKRASQEDKAIQLEKTTLAFDKYLISNHLWLDNTLLSTRKIGSDLVRKITEKMVNDYKVFSDLADRETYSETSLIQLKLLLNKLLREDEEENFKKLFHAIKEKHHLISDFNNQHFHTFLVNYCIAKVIEGKQVYYKQLLEVYIFAMDTGTLIEGKYLHPSHLRNIIVTSVKAEQSKLAHSLLEQYITYVHSDYRKVTEVYCKGYLHFQNEAYENANNLLRECTDMKSLFELDAQTILYKIYYETNQEWAFDIPVRSFIAKLSRHGNRLPQYTIKGYINFFRILKQIYQKKVNPAYKKTIEDIKENIAKMKYISDKGWLLEKLGELA